MRMRRGKRPLIDRICMMKIAVILFLTVQCSLAVYEGDGDCPAVQGERACVCNSPHGLVDLTSLANHPNQGPRYVASYFTS